IDILYLAPVPFIQELMNKAVAQVIFVALLLLLIAIFAPMLIARMWDCESLGESELKDRILKFCHSQGVKFKKILSWNALNRGLVTAGVVGLIKPFRYLLITPGLIRLLNLDEILAVVSHEVGHVKRRHLLYYFGFFIGFMVIIFGLLDRLMNLFLNTGFGFSLVISSSGEFNLSFLSFLRIFLSILIFITYFRFIFGYFMRNFEREADLYCFQSGINPDYLISSFMKLGARIGDDGKKFNWHHYNISQRIDFLKRSQENPDLISQHKRKIKRSLAVYFTCLLAFTFISFNPLASRVDGVLVTGVIEKLVQKNPENAQYYSYLAMLYYEQEKWVKAKNAYETAIRLNPRQADALNNLAWMRLKCPDKRFIDSKKALGLAEEAFRVRKAAYILDTLAEAYLANSRYKEAVIAAKRALEIATENLKYYRSQFKRMRRAYKKFGNSIAI
ncbi:MAG: M48 family metalloprotease, partial [Anaerolineales bacterium]|nr:M48 family metalloprotease [Anaerolineales bacterium]